MNRLKELSEVRRLPDEGILFGVCAGLADYYGWRRRTVRFVVAVLALLVNWPVILAYVAAIFLLPTPDEVEEEACHPSARSQRRHARRAAKRRGRPAGEDHTPLYSGNLRDRYATIEKRMRRVEAYLHGHEYQLRTAFRDLESG